MESKTGTNFKEYFFHFSIITALSSNDNPPPFIIFSTSHQLPYP